MRPYVGGKHDLLPADRQDGDAVSNLRVANYRVLLVSCPAVLYPDLHNGLQGQAQEFGYCVCFSQKHCCHLSRGTAPASALPRRQLQVHTAERRDPVANGAGEVPAGGFLRATPSRRMSRGCSSMERPLFAARTHRRVFISSSRPSCEDDRRASVRY